MKKIILCVDTGIDDFITLLVAGTQKEKFNIVGVCASYGNCDLQNATQNTIKALNLVGCDDVQVYQGSNEPLNGIKMRDATDVHGNNGLGDIEYKVITKTIPSERAEDFLIRKINENKGEITLIVTSPLTDVAKAIKKDEGFIGKLENLVIMGGGIKEGNITEYAEFNFYQDPEATSIVFENAQKKIIMIGLDVANKNVIDMKMMDFVSNIHTEKGAFIHKLFDKLEESILYDPLTICYLIEHSILKLKDADVKIIKSGIQAGRTVLNKESTNYNCMFAYDINVDKSREILLNNLFPNEF